MTAASMLPYRELTNQVNRYNFKGLHIKLSTRIDIFFENHDVYKQEEYQFE